MRTPSCRTASSNTAPGAQTSRRPPPRRHPRCPPPTLSWLCSAPVAQWIEQRFSKSICSGLAAVAVGNRRTFVGRSLLDRLECGLELAEFLVGECAEVGALIRAECFLDDRQCLSDGWFGAAGVVG